MRLIGPVVIFIIITGAVYAYSQRNVYHTVIVPGESVSLTIEVLMQRFGRSKNFAKEEDLAVSCNISHPVTSDGVQVVVIKTEHTVHKMRALLRISASSNAPAGKRKRQAEFELEGEGNWPRATIVVNVQK